MHKNYQKENILRLYHLVLRYIIVCHHQTAQELGGQLYLIHYFLKLRQTMENMSFTRGSRNTSVISSKMREFLCQAQGIALVIAFMVESGLIFAENVLAIILFVQEKKLHSFPVAPEAVLTSFLPSLSSPLKKK